MSQHPWWKWGIGIIGTLVVGALGSGVWEVAMRPALVSAGTVILSGVNLLSTTYKDSIYTHIARGFHEHSSLELQLLFTGLLSGSLVMTTLKLWEIYREAGRSLAGGDGNRKTRGLDFRNKKHMLAFASFSSFLFGVTVVILFVGSIASGYESRAIGHFHQVMAIAVPHLSDNEIAIFNSRFAQIATRNDYATLIADVEAKAKSAKQNVPKFSIW